MAPAHPMEGRTHAAGDLARMAHIARVAAVKGWGRHLEKLRLGRAPVAAERGVEARGEAARLREALEELGPTFVKFGRMMATRADVFPAELVAELGKLRERAEPFPAPEARRIIEEALGKPVSAVYASFDDRPMAAWPVAQVHCATLLDGTPVVVKVQRPAIEPAVEADIAVLRRLARLLPRVLPSTRALNLPQLVEEAARSLREELDFEREAHNAERFAEANRGEPAVFVPAVFWQATARRVLTMEHSLGHRLEGAGARRPMVARLLMRLFLTQVFEHGVFHADPHAGNVFVLADGRLCFHDFGALGELPPAVQENLRELFLAVMARDAGWVAGAYLRMGGAGASVDRPRFVTELQDALDRSAAPAAGGGESLAAMLDAFVQLGRDHGVRLQGATALLIRAFAGVEALARSLDPGFSPLGSFHAYSGRLLKHVFVPEGAGARTARPLRPGSALREAAREAPLAVQRLLGRLERGEPVFELRHRADGSVERQLLHAANRLALALIIASLLVASALLLAARSAPPLVDVAMLGVIGFSLAGALVAAWAVIAFRSGRL